MTVLISCSWNFGDSGILQDPKDSRILQDPKDSRIPRIPQDPKDFGTQRYPKTGLLISAFPLLQSPNVPLLLQEQSTTCTDDGGRARQQAYEDLLRQVF